MFHPSHNQSQKTSLVSKLPQLIILLKLASQASLRSIEHTFKHEKRDGIIPPRSA